MRRPAVPPSRLRAAVRRRRALRPATLAGRLALSGVAWIAGWGLGLLLAFNLMLSTVLDGQIDAALRARAEAVVGTVTVRGDELRLPGPTQDEALDAGTSVYRGTTLVEGVDLSPKLRRELLQRGAATADRESTGVRYVARPITVGDRQVGTVVVSSDIGALGRTGRIVALTSLVFIGLLLAVTFVALRATVARALRPVRLMGDQASAWSDADLDRRFEPLDAPTELRELARTLNALLDRILAALRHERTFTAELSHELRTPLAHLHAELDLLASAADHPTRPEPVTGDDLTALLTSVRRLEGLVETALAPARATQLAGPGLGRVDEALRGLRAPADADVDLRVTGDVDARLAVDSDVVRRALVPVLENAFRYADHQVSVDVRRNGAMVEIVVEDDGGRLDPAAATRIFEPGFRADPADGHPGAGLGLALARRICRSAGGEVTAGVAEGRTTVTLSLPGLAG